MKNIRNILSFLLVIPVAAQAAEQSSDVESLDALRAFIEVYEHIKGEYVEEIDDQTLLKKTQNLSYKPSGPVENIPEPSNNLTNHVKRYVVF